VYHQGSTFTNLSVKVSEKGKNQFVVDKRIYKLTVTLLKIRQKLISIRDGGETITRLVNNSTAIVVKDQCLRQPDAACEFIAWINDDKTGNIAKEVKDETTDRQEQFYSKDNAIAWLNSHGVTQITDTDNKIQETLDDEEQKYDCPFIRETIAFCLPQIVKNTNIGNKNALGFIREQTRLLVFGMMDPHKCVQSDVYTDIGDFDALPHTHAAKVMMDRGSKVCEGDKIDFIITLPKFEKGPVNKRISERAYDIGHFDSCGRHKIDALEYINQLKNHPICQYMRFVAGRDLDEIFEQAHKDVLDHKNRHSKIMSAFLQNPKKTT
jgi:hypothetical protein